MLFILLGFAYVQDSRYGLSYPAYAWATAFGVLSSLWSLITGSSFVAALISGVILTLYAWGYFVILRIFSDNVILWLLICLVGLLFPFILPMMLMA